MVKVYYDMGTKYHEHTDAFHTAVSDGHLHLLTDSGTGAAVVAVYAPGAWKRAEVDVKPDAS